MLPPLCPPYLFAHLSCLVAQLARAMQDAAAHADDKVWASLCSVNSHVMRSVPQSAAPAGAAIEMTAAAPAVADPAVAGVPAASDSPAAAHPADGSPVAVARASALGLGLGLAVPAGGSGDGSASAAHTVVASVSSLEVGGGTPPRVVPLDTSAAAAAGSAAGGADAGDVKVLAPGPTPKSPRFKAA